MFDSLTQVTQTQDKKKKRQNNPFYIRIIGFSSSLSQSYHTQTLSYRPTTDVYFKHRLTAVMLKDPAVIVRQEQNITQERS